MDGKYKWVNKLFNYCNVEVIMYDMNDNGVYVVKMYTIWTHNNDIICINIIDTEKEFVLLMRLRMDGVCIVEKIDSTGNKRIGWYGIGVNYLAAQIDEECEYVTGVLKDSKMALDINMNNNLSLTLSNDSIDIKGINKIIKIGYNDDKLVCIEPDDVHMEHILIQI